MSHGKVYVIHENSTWVIPLRDAFKQQGIEYEEWFTDEGVLDLTSIPPEGVFYNRMSASSHTRNHIYGPEYTSCVLAWLEGHGRKLLNGSVALRYEVNKAAQDAALRKFGIPTPKTIVAVGKQQIIEAARKFDGPFLTKHNRAGSGYGIKLFYNIRTLEEYVNGPDFIPSRDGITLVQQYIQAPTPYITRLEFINGKFLYAVRVRTNDQGFNLCPSDACVKESAATIKEQSFVNCPIDKPEREVKDATTKEPPQTIGEEPKFTILKGFEHPVIPKLLRFIEANQLGVTGIEFVEDGRGNYYVYDVNTNTNYNGAAEKVAQLDLPNTGMGRIALELGELLKSEQPAISERLRLNQLIDGVAIE